jgi:hypothetical protein
MKLAIAELKLPRVQDASASDELKHWIAMGALCCLWLGLVTFGWARWGSVTVDSGREIYVAAALAQGKMLYRDVWYPYCPGAPYLNAVLFRIFGIHLTFLYLIGPLAVLAVALMLFRCALYLVSLPVAFVIGYIVLIQSFRPGIFNYPLPYSYAAVYGSVAASFFLLYAIRSSLDSTKANLFWAAIGSGVALLMKLEYGLACFGTLAVLQIGLIARQRSSRAAFANLLTMIPGLIVCTLVGGWMISIKGVTFITEENFTSWPTSYFMRAYGRFWLRGQGFELSSGKLLGGILTTVGFVTFWTTFRFWLRSVSRKLSLRNASVAIIAVAGAIAFWMIRPERISEDIAMLVFPRPMVFMVGMVVPIAAFRFCRYHWQSQDLVILVTMIFGVLLASRILFGMLPHAYAIFYNGPVLLAFCWLLFSIAIPADSGHREPRMKKAIVALCAVLCTWVTVQVYPEYREMRNHRVAFESKRGTTYLPETMLPAWAEAVDFMRHANAAGRAVISIPEDTALYFFAETLCPIRICIFHPGVVAPGRMMHQVIAEISQARVQYIIWSNRKFYEYGVPEFGVDFDTPLGDYIRANYRPARKLASGKWPDGWHATVWEKN